MGGLVVLVAFFQLYKHTDVFPGLLSSLQLHGKYEIRAALIDQGGLFEAVIFRLKSKNEETVKSGWKSILRVGTAYAKAICLGEWLGGMQEKKQTRQRAM